jgi:hypothetical protein
MFVFPFHYSQDSILLPGAAKCMPSDRNQKQSTVTVWCETSAKLLPDASERRGVKVAAQDDSANEVTGPVSGKAAELARHVYGWMQVFERIARKTRRRFWMDELIPELRTIHPEQKPMAPGYFSNSISIRERAEAHAT